MCYCLTLQTAFSAAVMSHTASRDHRCLKRDRCLLIHILTFHFFLYVFYTVLLHSLTALSSWLPPSLCHGFEPSCSLSIGLDLKCHGNSWVQAGAGSATQQAHPALGEEVVCYMGMGFSCKKGRVHTWEKFNRVWVNKKSSLLHNRHWEWHLVFLVFTVPILIYAVNSKAFQTLYLHFP